jgi:hypothetical protein
MPDAFTCPICGMVSHHPQDVRERYCGNCHGLTAEEPPPGVRWVRLRDGDRIIGRLVPEPLPDDYHMVASGEVYERVGDDEYRLKVDKLEFVSEAEQARIDAFPADLREQITGIMRSMNRMRPDLNQPGSFDGWLTVLERRFADELRA